MAGSAVQSRPGLRLEGKQNESLSASVLTFLEAGGNGDVGTVIGTYDPGFECIRVADGREPALLDRKELERIWTTPNGHSVQTGDTILHHSEVLSDHTGVVLMTRWKNLGSGWAPMFYTLVWTRDGGEWRLLREFVFQR